MKKALGMVLMNVLKYALLIYSASRSVDFIMLTLPPERHILAYFAIAALDGGLVIWEQIYRHGSQGGLQRALALGMTVVDLLGAIAMFTLDALLRTGEAGMTTALTPSELWIAVIALNGVIGLNIGVLIAFGLAHPDVRRAAAEEEAQARIEDLAIEKIGQSSEQIAAELAPLIAADWIDETRVKHKNLLAGKKRTRLPAPTDTPRLLAMDTGKQPEITGNDVEDLPVTASNTEPNPTPRRRKQN